MFGEIIFTLALILFLFFVAKHSLGLRKVDRYLKNSKDEFYQDRESSLIKFSTYEPSKSDTAYEYIWSQRYTEHKDNEFVLLCSKTFKSGLYSIALIIILILCM